MSGHQSVVAGRIVGGVVGRVGDEGGVDGAGQGHHEEDGEDVREKDAAGEKAANSSNQGNVLKNDNILFKIIMFHAFTLTPKMKMASRT